MIASTKIICGSNAIIIVPISAKELYFFGLVDNKIIAPQGPQTFTDAAQACVKFFTIIMKK